MSPETFTQVWEIYENAFPTEEKRALAQQQALLENGLYQVFPYFDPTETEVLGFITIWHLPQFTFWEHLAVKESCRGQGIGSKIIEATRQVSGEKIVFEVELPETEIAKRRIGLYKRLGFHLNSYPYFQPAYQDHSTGVDMLIMSYPSPLSPSEFKDIEATLYKEVYNYSS